MPGYILRLSQNKEKRGHVLHIHPHSVLSAASLSITAVVSCSGTPCAHKGDSVGPTSEQVDLLCWALQLSFSGKQALPGWQSFLECGRMPVSTVPPAVNWNPLYHLFFHCSEPYCLHTSGDKHPYIYVLGISMSFVYFSPISWSFLTSF